MKKHLLLFILLFCLTNYSFGQVCQDGSTPEELVLDLTGINTVDVEGDADNDSGTFCFPSGMMVNVVGVSWDGIDLGPIGGSWCSEPVISFATPGAAPSLYITPGTGEDNAGPCNNGYTLGFLPLVVNGLSNIATDAGGCINWEAFEGYDDFVDATDQTFTGGTMTLYSCAVALPIELVEFKGEVKKGHNLLTWKTATEINSLKHIIETSPNGKDGWSSVGQVDAVGNSTELNSYSIEDVNPTSVAYYRLKELSLDNQIQYSDIILVKRFKRSVGQATVFPMPVDDKLTIQFESPSQESAVMNVMDVEGRIVSTKSIELEDNINTIDLDVSNLTSGIYFISVQNQSNSIREKFIKK